jgi:uncharacterized integral membrane protein
MHAFLENRMRPLSLFLFLLAVSTMVRSVTPAAAQDAITYTKDACHFYGQADSPPAWNKDDSCIIPEVEHLDRSFRQTDFVCCGGGATANTTSADIPPGLEIVVTGAHYWSVYAPQLSGDRLTLHTYCGPPNCNVNVYVKAHYKITQTTSSPAQSETSPPSGVKAASQTASSDSSSSWIDKLGIDKFLAFLFGAVVLIILLIVAVFDRKPTPLGILIYRVLLALAAAGIGAVIPGLISVTVSSIIRAGGAIALFVIVFWFNPPRLISE